MATIDSSYFFGPINIAQKSAVSSALTMFIDEHEDKLLTDLLGYELYKLYKNGIEAATPDAKWLAIRDGVEYTNRNGRLTKWRGLRYTSSGANTGSITDVIRFLDPILFKIGDGEALTPALHAIRYTNPLLEDLTLSQFTIHRNGYGFLFPATFVYDAAGWFELIPPDRFNVDEEFTIQIRKHEITEAAIGAGTKKSLIANYVYWHWLENELTSTTGTGEKVIDNQNASNASPVFKMVSAWNQMVNWNCELIDFLLTNDSDYPEFQDYHSWIPRNIIKKQNPFGI
jgi:hypothetical protein